MRFARLALVMMIALLVAVSLGLSKQEYSKKESKTCTFCHPAGKFKELTDAGKYYKDHNHSLDGFQAGDKK